ncbi:MAG: hypothetical protein ACJ8AW_23265 [Rhodopila sp.]
MQHLLPIDAGRSPETLRSHTLEVGQQLADAVAETPLAGATAITISLDSTFIRHGKRWRGHAPIASSAIAIEVI